MNYHLIIFILLGFVYSADSYSAPSLLKSCVELYKHTRTTGKLYRGSLLKDSDPALYKIFENARLNSSYSLTEAEQSYLSDNSLGGLYEQWKNSNAVTKRLNKELADVYRSQLHSDSETFFMKAAKGLGKTLFPQYRLFAREGLSKKIADKIILDPKYELNASDAAYIKKKNMVQDLERFRGDVASGLGDKFATISKVRQIGKNLTWTVALSGAAIGLSGNSYISKKESFDENSSKGMSRYDDKVELIYLSPMPHVSLRMGGNVYNYGVLDVNRLNLDNYRQMAGFGDGLSGNHVRIELKLNDEEKDRLREYLESDVGKVYPLALPFVDCVSQTNKAIKFATGISIPPIANRSQALTIAYLKLRKALGNDKIGDITFASSGNPVIEKAKDSAINVLDSMLFMKYGPQLMLISPLLDQSKLTFDPRSGMDK